MPDIRFPVVVRGDREGVQLDDIKSESVIKVQVLAISGSLRERSYNSSAVRALKELAPDDMFIRIRDIAQLPLFNPDLEGVVIKEVEVLKHELATSQGLRIASPEYAHGVSGPMKNALDWLVSGAEFQGKHVMLINTSPRAVHAENSLKEIVNTMSGVLVESVYVSIPLLGTNLSSDDIVADQRFALTLIDGLVVLKRLFCSTGNPGHG